MRNINVTKYRKLLYEIQKFCSQAKRYLYTDFKKQNKRTDFERGYIAGKHAAYNEVLRNLHKLIKNANIDWNNISCREEQILKEIEKI